MDITLGTDLFILVSDLFILVSSRRSGPASFGIYNREYTLGDELRVVDAGAWGTDISTGSFAGVSPFNDSTFQTERPHTVQESCKKKPPGLTQDALQCLQSEVFSCLGKGIEGGSSPVSRDCSIYVSRVSVKETSLFVCPVTIDSTLLAWILGSGLVGTAHIVEEI